MQPEGHSRISSIEAHEEDCSWHNCEECDGGYDAMCFDQALVSVHCKESISHAIVAHRREIEAD